tara:strand:- start:55 stop:288 length:234 start_codon:yes stop_codon:yes gene_type:complete
MPRKRIPLVTVEWRDILGTAGWEKPEEVNPPVIWTTGYLIEKGESVVKVAHTKDGKGNWSGITAFPTGCIVKIRNAS